MESIFFNSGLSLAANSILIIRNQNNSRSSHHKIHRSSTSISEHDTWYNQDVSKM